MSGHPIIHMLTENVRATLAECLRVHRTAEALNDRISDRTRPRVEDVARELAMPTTRVGQILARTPDELHSIAENVHQRQEALWAACEAGGDVGELQDRFGLREIIFARCVRIGERAGRLTVRGPLLTPEQQANHSAVRKAAVPIALPALPVAAEAEAMGCRIVSRSTDVAAARRHARATAIAADWHRRRGRVSRGWAWLPAGAGDEGRMLAAMAARPMRKLRAAGCRALGGV